MALLDPMPQARDTLSVEDTMSLPVVETARGRDRGAWSQEGLIVHGAEQVTGGSVDSAVLHPFARGEHCSTDSFLMLFLESVTRLGHLRDITLPP